MIPASKADRAHLAAIAASIALGAALRVRDSFRNPFTPDQGFSLDLARGGWADLVAATAADTHPPFYYALLKAWFAVFPDTLFSGQVLSILFSIGTIAMVAAFAWRRFGRGAATAAVATWALSAYLGYWNHSVRNHQLLPLAMIAIAWCSWEHLRSGARWALWASAAAWILAFQANYMAFPAGLVWCAALLAAGGSWRRRGALVAMSALGPLSLLPWLPVAYQHGTDGPAHAGFFQETVSPVYLYFHAVFGAAEPYQPPKSGPLFLLAMGVFAWVVVESGRVIRRDWFLWILLAGLPTLPILLAKAGGMTLAERHLAFAIPVFLVFWGAGVAAAAERILPHTIRRSPKREGPPAGDAAGGP